MGGCVAVRHKNQREPARERREDGPTADGLAPGGRRAPESSLEQEFGDTFEKIRAGARERSEALREVDEERGVSLKRTSRGRYEWEQALLDKHDALVTRTRIAVHERFRRDASALTNFESVMQFALPARVEALVLGALFHQVLVFLPGPLKSLVGVVRTATGIYDAAQSAARGVSLAQWVQAHRDAANAAEAREWDLAAELGPLRARIDELLMDESDPGELAKMELETALRDPKPEVTVTVPELEAHLYDAWCRQSGATWVANVFRTDREYPGHEELGTIAGPGGDAAQLKAKGVPPQIIGRLLAMGVSPVHALRLPTTVHHHRRDEQGRWRETHATVFDHRPKGEEATP
jgi:hypothetical protein